MKYDRDEWHSNGNFPADLPPENGGTHIGMFLAWAIIHGLAGPDHHRRSKTELDAVQARLMTGREFLRRRCGGKFWSCDLNDEGNAFAKEYYGGGGKAGEYFDDYFDVLALTLSRSTTSRTRGRITTSSPRRSITPTNNGGRNTPGRPLFLHRRGPSPCPFTGPSVPAAPARRGARPWSGSIARHSLVRLPRRGGLAQQAPRSAEVEPGRRQRRVQLDRLLQGGAGLRQLLVPERLVPRGVVRLREVTAGSCPSRRLLVVRGELEVLVLDVGAAAQLDGF